MLNMDKNSDDVLLLQQVYLLFCFLLLSMDQLNRNVGSKVQNMKWT